MKKCNYFKVFYLFLNLFPFIPIFPSGVWLVLTVKRHQPVSWAGAQRWLSPLGASEERGHCESRNYRVGSRPC